MKYRKKERNLSRRFSSAAEQILKIQDGSKHVINFINSKGFKLSPQELDTIIEAAVKELNFITQELKN